MAEMNAAQVLESMILANHVPPYPAGEITERSLTVKRKLFGITKQVKNWRLWIGGTEFRDYASKGEAEAAKTLMGL